MFFNNKLFNKTKNFSARQKKNSKNIVLLEKSWIVLSRLNITIPKKMFFKEFFVTVFDY